MIYFFRILSIMMILTNLCWGYFDPTRFNFGTDWDFLGKDNNDKGSVAQAIDYVTIWLNDPEFNQYWHGAMLEFCKKNKKTPVFYAYIIAKASGLGDSDVGGRLDQEGGNWLRGNFNTVKQRYEHYAEEAAKYFSKTDPIIWLMEPDYYQYCNGYGNDISMQEAANYMHEMIGCVKKYLPNALFSLDISPWNNDQASYINHFDMSEFSFMNTSGGRTEAGSDRIRYDNNNNVTWSSVNNISGKCIIADDGYGTGGGTIGHDPTWDDINNLRNRIRDGVAAITQKSPNSNWGSTINSLKSSLSSENTKCNFEFPSPKYSIKVTIKGEGNVLMTPNESAFDSGTTVTLTAQPGSGYRFLSWDGDVNGTDETVYLKMDDDKNVTASFVDINAKTKFILTISTNGSGIVEIEPKQTEFDSGSSVTLTARTINGAEFISWSGDLSGINQRDSIVIDGHKQINASFSGNDISIENLVENGDFSDGDAQWAFGAYESAEAEGVVEEGKFQVDIMNKGTEDWQIQLMQEDINLKKGTKYQLSFNASSQENATIIALIGMGEEPYDSYLRKDVKLTSEEKNYKYTFSMRSEPTSSDRIEFTSGTADAGWIIDDITLTEFIELDPFTSVKPRSHFTSKKVSGIKHATVIQYDYSGRAIKRSIGDYNKIMKQFKHHSPGCYITVVDIDGVKSVKKTVITGR
ncbi:MAG TPA: carbohydrate binding domain-containing protein [Chitinispirillaceae bacterium]|nr:carbohydrate binding domain-containing protein [Chitinispirillaceae bacterium]